MSIYLYFRCAAWRTLKLVCFRCECRWSLWITNKLKAFSNKVCIVLPVHCKHFQLNFSSSKMPPNHKYQKCICLICTICFITGLNCGVDVDNKMCLLYEFNNYASNNTEVIERFDGMTKPQCMLSCVRNNSCVAFNFRRNDGNCELLETVEGCMSHDITMGTIFVQLTKCDGTAPWKVMSQTLEKLQWREPRHIGDREVVRADAHRHVVRVLYQGVYLTGFIRDSINVVFVVDMNGNRIRCPLSVQVLTSVDSNDYSWLKYEMGDPIPSSAVVGGYGQDGTPLYVVNIMMKNWKPSYYNEHTKQFYVNRMDGVVKAAQILVEN